MAGQFQMYEPVQAGNTGGSESLENNPAYLTHATVDLDRSNTQTVGADGGYEVMATPAPKLQQRQADS